MNKLTTLSLVLALVVIASMSAVAQRAAITIEAMSPHRLHELGWTSNTSTGLSVVPKGTVVYLSDRDLSGGTITACLWEMTARPVGSTTTLDSVNTHWTTFRPDLTGQYQIKLTITTTAGTHDTTVTITAAEYTGVGGVGGVPPSVAQGQCAGCHGGTFPGLADMATPWRSSGHATMFQRGIDGAVASYYSGNCISCHTTGYYTAPEANNKGFDDLRTLYGWQFPTTLQPGNFSALVTAYPQLAQVATIGCETCHGPGSMHYGDATKTAKTMSSGVCSPCHDEPWRHNRYAQWENAGHSEPVWSNSFRSSGTTVLTDYTLNACVRCHDGQAFVNFTKGIPFDNRTSTGYSQVKQTAMTCQTCHEPHTGGLRSAPAGSDTLANGFSYTTMNLGEGKTCFNCHKYRRNGETYPNVTAMSTTWGPHYAGTADVFLGKNAYTFGQSIPSSIAHQMVEKTCVGCHMSATPDTGTVARDKIGGHSWAMSYTPTGGARIDNVTGCTSCHGSITSFSNIVASYDYDGDGTIEPFIDEVSGLQDRIALALPPRGSLEINRTLIASDPDSVNLKRAYYNYLFTKYDGSHGVHNPKYVVGVLHRSLFVLTGVDLSRSDEIPSEFALEQNYPNPFNPSTTISFSVPAQSPVRLDIFDITGQLVTTLVDEDLAVGSYKVVWRGQNRNGIQAGSGVYIYRLQTENLTLTKKMLLVK